jgi:hypothetical protein
MSWVLVYPSTNWALVWDAVVDATSYVVQVGTATGQSDELNLDVGDLRTYSIWLNPGTHYTRIVPYIGAVAQTSLAEETVTI